MINITPLNANSTSSLLQNLGLNINPVAESYMGISKLNSSYTPGKTVNDTCLYLLTYGINIGYIKRYLTGDITSTIYNNLISIGSTTIPALGNSKPSTYVAVDPTGIWARPQGSSTQSVAELYGIQQGVAGSLPGPASSGYSITSDTDQGQEATWIPYDTTNANSSVTQWGYLRLYALQAWYEFNWNGTPTGSVRYQDFCASFMSMVAFINNTNFSVNAFANGPTYLDGVYSNMNDLISADITGVSLSTKVFGQDCITLGKVIDLSQIDKFGLPSILLQTLKKYNAITQSLSLALLASGLLASEVDSISKGSGATFLQEQKIYGAFLIILGQDLIDILIPLNCKTKNLESLADLLNVKKIFPNSYQTLTVPLYNLAPSPNNSKTYYPIYDNTGVNSRLNTPAVKEQVGTIIPPGIPTINQTTDATIQPLPTGFDSYLVNILPNDLALAAGAFSYSMRQVKNIQYADFEKFAQVAYNVETIINLNLVNGSNVPANVPLMNQGKGLIGLGTGPNNTFTVSDFFGCMSGLPYNWKKLTSLISSLQTTKLSNIYYELYLALDWTAAAVSVQYTSYLVGPTTYYKVTGVTITNSGGGYGRGTAPAPTITINGGSGATATATIGTDKNNLSTFGKVATVTLTSSGTDTTTIPTVTIQCPPTATLAVQTNGNRSTSGTNTASGTTGWSSPMSAVVSAYITQANTEIQSINTNGNATYVQNIKSLYNQFGTQLMIEQRARYIAVTPVPIPRDLRLNPYPTMQIAFTDSLQEFSKNTLPHMQSQTVEAISNLNLTGGQSIVASMREARNKLKNMMIGVPLDNNMPTVLTQTQTKELLCNGVLGTPTTEIPGVGNNLTIPSTESQFINNDLNIPVLYEPISDGVLINPYETDENGSSINTSGTLGYPPVYYINGEPIDEGQAIYPGSFAGSKATNMIPLTLNTTYTSGTTLPVTFSIPDAIDQVIHCNCNCWLG